MKKSWWKAELPNIERELRKHLFHRLPSRRDTHDDLVNETLLAVSEWMRTHGSPGLSSEPNPSIDDERHALMAFSKVVLKRRIADQFRLDAREWTRRLDMDSNQLAGVAQEAPAIEHDVLIRRMLEITIAVLAKMPREDRDLIAFTAGGAEGARALTARERQRLRRARVRISKAIVAELGSSAANLLRPEE